jgi:branched-chain amino acid transport system substrate-binding protein
MRGRTRRNGVGLVCLAVALIVLAGILAGCGDESTETTAAPTQTTAASTQTTAASTEPFKLGVLLDMTGAMADFGLGARKGVEAYVDLVNKAGGINGRMVEISLQDSASDATKANAAVLKLIEQDKVDALIGPSWGALYTQVAEVAERNEIPLIYPGPAQPESRLRNYRWSFATLANATYYAKSLHSIIKLEGFTKIVGIADVEGFMQEELDVMANLAKADGITFERLTDTFSPADVDVTSQATKVKQAVESIGADAIVICSVASDGCLLAKSLANLGVTLPIIGHGAFDSPPTFTVFPEIGVDFYSSLLASAHAPDLPDAYPYKAQAMEFENKHQAMFGEPGSMFGTGPWLAAQMYSLAFAAVGNDKTAIRDYLEGGMGSVDTLWGPMKYTPEPLGHEGATCFSLIPAKLTSEGTWEYIGIYDADGNLTPLE